ncbi:hypothetical protein [Azospirillum picis]|uniref:Uncharacterized protein n=1 Tax=Azospirillum picis TaxID=488438 RepID=A0ABU0MDH7_9PROT|nr:hypothetical protein [Azospirillum picis]MBP2297497.1 hypothetical protein [Azospirillum picis]MDQ0531480.1 hypothetical protein [Azospirillum picis]
MTDTELAHSVREAVERLNLALAEAARHNLAVTLRTTSHQTTGGVEQVVVEPQIFKQL